MESGIETMHVTSVVMSRFSKVTVNSKMRNNQKEAQEMTFSLRLPDAAFITELVMVVGGATYVGEVKKKQSAKDQYDEAVAMGSSAGLVTADVRETQTFNVAANVPAGETATFNLVYQQLLQRKHGKYDHVVLVNPGKVVDDFVITVYLMENAGICSLSTHGPINDEVQQSEFKIETDVEKSENQAKITFKPTPDQQRHMLLMIPEKERKLTVSYDVNRKAFGGEIQIQKGHFVHFFAPENLPVLPKNVVFVIDRSGSMSGTKMEQTQDAFVSVLKALKQGDKFNIVVFDDTIDVWNAEMLVEASSQKLAEAIRYVRAVGARASTDLNSAMMRATEMFKHVQRNDRAASMIILLTDGNPNHGVSNQEEILRNVKRAVAGRYSVFCLGFGHDLNHDFLQRMANENDGISRHIHEDSDADLQLRGFFEEVAAPVLRHVRMNYIGAPVGDVTNTEFGQHFSGSEAVVVGTIREEGEVNLSAQVSSLSIEGDILHEVSCSKMDANVQKWSDEVGNIDDFGERIWAYFTIRELLQKKVITVSQSDIKELDRRIESLALKYSFVTPLTSMVVSASKAQPVAEPSTQNTFSSLFSLKSLKTFFSSKNEPNAGELPVHVLGNSSSANMRSSVPDRYLGHKTYGGMAQAKSKKRRYKASSFMSYRVQRSSMDMDVTDSYDMALCSTDSYHAHSRRRTASDDDEEEDCVDGMYDDVTDSYMAKCSTDSYHAPGRRRTASDDDEEEDCADGMDDDVTKLTASSGTVTSPESISRKSETRKWKIKLKKGSWIDLHLETICTTENEVIITVKGEIILHHIGGTIPSKHILIENNQALITMMLFVRDKSKPVIVISYTEIEEKNRDEYVQGMRDQNHI